MRTPLDELKTRARLLRNAAPGGAAPRLRDCLHEVARAVGFADWEHARTVLAGLATPGDDMGSFWHAPRSGILLNLWFARYDEARAALVQGAASYLLPYRRQFFAVQSHFLPEIGLDPSDPAWAEAGHDLVRAYGTPAWRRLALQRMQAPPGSFAAVRRGARQSG